MNQKTSYKKADTKKDTTKTIQNQVTVNHMKIKEWAEKRNGKPTMLLGTPNQMHGLLYIDFGEGEFSFQEITWQYFFKVFENRGYAFLYEQNSDNSLNSKFYKFIDRESDMEFDDEEEIEIIDDNMDI